MTAATSKTELGVPSTQEGMYGLSLEDMTEICGRVAGFVAAWDDDLKTQFEHEQGDMIIDSAIGLFVLTLLTEEFPQDLIDFTAIDPGQWQTLGGVASIVYEAVQSYRASHE
ncbi:hypothetical protein ACIQCM_00495 [Pseudarthrobacter sp. NPDC092439]|uniref:hypothetical protein n=1 Tax=unclassified Pseudarthrobacter TaxID=2647000 RepID=UPI0037F3E578